MRTTFPDGPGVLKRVWDRAYETGYQVFRALSMFVVRPLFLVRPVGPVPEIPAGPLIVCANHASYLDPVFVQFVIERRLVFVMTKEFYRRWSGRWFFRAARAIPVASGRHARRGLVQALARLRQGQAIGIFPEGRLTRDGTLGPPQRGVSFLARMGRAPILPLGIFGNRRAWPRGAPCFRRSDVRIAFGPLLPPPPIRPAPGREEEQTFTHRIMDEVAAAKRRAKQSGRSQTP